MFLIIDRLNPLFWSHRWKSCFFSKKIPHGWIIEMNRISCSLRVKQSTIAPVPPKRKMMKILSAWWNFRSSERWNVFLSVDRLKPLFWSHLWRNCFFLKNPLGWITVMNRISCSLKVKRSRSAPGPQKEIRWRWWVHDETSEVLNVGTCF